MSAASGIRANAEFVEMWWRSRNICTCENAVVFERCAIECLAAHRVCLRDSTDKLLIVGECSSYSNTD